MRSEEEVGESRSTRKGSGKCRKKTFNSRRKILSRSSSLCLPVIHHTTSETATESKIDMSNKIT